MIEKRINRRQVLATAAGTFAGLTFFAGRPALGQEQGSEKGRRGPRGFRIGVCDWTIGKRCDPAAFAAAKKIGLDGVQVDFGGSPDKDPPLFDAELQKRYAEEIQAQEMRIASLAMGVLNDVPYKSDPRAEKWVDKAIDVAQAMNMRQRIILLAFFSKGDLKNDAAGHRRRGQPAQEHRIQGREGRT